MNIQPVSKSTLVIAANLTNANFFTLAKSKWMFDTNKNSTTILLYNSLKSSGQTVFAASDTAGGTSDPITEVTPAFYPVATKGAECGAVVTSLSWADQNLGSGYEWVKLASGVFFVSGLLNSSETLSNNPFNTAAGRNFTAGGCWSGSFSAEVAPTY
jgi:hypothetical protein